MRVLHVINTLGAGGAERSLAEMLPLFTRAGVESRVACLAHASEGVHERVEADGVQVTVVGPSRATSLLRLHRLIRAWRPHVVHTTIYDADVLGRLATTGQQVKVLTSLVNTTYDGVRVADAQISPWKFAAAKAVDQVTARHLTDHFHAISGAVKDSAVKHLGIDPDRVTVVERGRDLGRLGEPSPQRRAATRDRLGVPQGAEVVIHVGRQEPQKDLPTLLDAFAKLVAARPDLLLLQVGRGGKATAEVRRRADQLGLEDRVRFLGYRDDIGDLLSAADVFAFPSIYEGLGGSLLEAMAMRLPIVVTDVPALMEVVEDGRGASVVPVRDSYALAQAVGHLLEDRVSADQMAARAQQIFFDRFTLERSAERMVDLYRTLAGTGAD